jgi:predicted dehydrogenase
MTYRYAGGALGTLDATTRLVGPHVFEQVIRGSEGQLQLAPTLRFWSQRTFEGYASGRWHTLRDLPRSAERRVFFEAFADAVLDHRAPPVAAREARAVQATIAAAYLSAERKANVEVRSS